MTTDGRGKPLTTHSPSVPMQMPSPISRWPARATHGWHSRPALVASFSVSFLGLPELPRRRWHGL